MQNKYLPDQLLTDGSSFYVMYLAESPGTEVGGVLFLPVYVGKHKDVSLYCLRFEVDPNDLVKGYKIKSEGSAWGHNPYLDCRKKFWNHVN